MSTKIKITSDNFDDYINLGTKHLFNGFKVLKSFNVTLFGNYTITLIKDESEAGDDLSN